ncbi:MAG: alpha-ribazole phosphatase family protein [Magnetococcales bacterium]|nr:alpha-ribazole phosphatase family protein [Magnetococcales bacterium]
MKIIKYQTEPPTLVDMLRHGEPQGGSKYRGTVDDPLSETGWAQMRGTVAKAQPWGRIITSPLKRCAEFAHELGGRMEIPVVVDERFVEFHFGRWEGRTADEILQDDGERLKSFWKDPLNNPPPDGEHLRDFCDRVATGWDALQEQYQGEHILLVAHSGIIRAAISHILGMPPAYLSRMMVPFAALIQTRSDTVDGVVIPRLLFHSEGKEAAK